RLRANTEVLVGLQLFDEVAHALRALRRSGDERHPEHQHDTREAPHGASQAHARTHQHHRTKYTRSRLCLPASSSLGARRTKARRPRVAARERCRSSLLQAWSRAAEKAALGRELSRLVAAKNDRLPRWFRPSTLR